MRRVYLVLFVVLMALAATGVHLRQRAKAAAAALQPASGQAAADCASPAPPVPSRVEGPSPPSTPAPSTPPPNLPGFAIEPACGTGAETAKAAEKKK